MDRYDILAMQRFTGNCDGIEQSTVGLLDFGTDQPPTKGNVVFARVNLGNHFGDMELTVVEMCKRWGTLDGILDTTGSGQDHPRIPAIEG